MPQLLKSFRPQEINTSYLSAPLFIQTFLTNPQTAIQDTINQVKPNNLIIETIAGYYTEGHQEKQNKNVLNSGFAPYKENTYLFSGVDCLNNYLRHGHEGSPLEFTAWLDKNNIPRSSHHPISQDKTQKD